MEITTYLNFDLLIQRESKDYRARVQDSPIGETSESFTLPFTPADVAALSVPVGQNRHSGDDFQIFGEQLYTAVFHGQVGNCLARSLDAAKRESKGLRIRLRLNEVPELAGLPWEYLHDPSKEHFFVLSDQTPIVRYLEMQSSQQPLELARPLRILIVIANPYDFAPLNVEEEQQKVKNTLSALQQRGFVVIERLQQARLVTLQKQLRKETYHILHFIGHGWVDEHTQQSGLVLEDVNGRSDLVPTSVLGTLLHDHRSLRLVLLNACQGAQMTERNPFAGTAQHLVQQGLPSVIAMQFPISDQAAIVLTHEFYKALADGYPVDAALAEARKAIYAQQHKGFEWGTPVLFMREPDGRLFEISGVGEDAPAPGVSPYKGLRYFEEEDAERFFGREEVVGELISHLQTGRFLAVVGASGSGKSSLVRAGLIPALRAGKPLEDDTLPPAGSQHWPIHIITPTTDPLEALAASFASHSGSVRTIDTFVDDLAYSERALHLYVRKLLAQDGAARLLLVVDQFEELFTLCKDSTKRKAFVDNLLTAVTIDGPTVLVITLRADFYAQCAHFDHLRQALESSQKYIGSMNAQELRRAIEGPAQQGNWEFEPGLVDELLKDVGSEPGALPLLSHALLETWQRRRGRMLTFAGYAASGGVQGAIAHTAEQVFQQHLNDSQQAIARRIFLQLTELGEGTQDTRRRVTINELVRQREEVTKVDDVLQILANARLITTDVQSAEVAHEALIREWPTLRQWLNEDREGLRVHRQLNQDAQQWLALNRDPGALYRGARLVQALEWAETHIGKLNTLERRYLGTSKEVVKREEEQKEEWRQKELKQAQALAASKEQGQRRLKWFSASLLVLFLLAIVFAFQANTERQNAIEAKDDAIQAEKEAVEARTEAIEAKTEAQKQARIAHARELAAQDPFMVDYVNDTELITLLAIEARNLNNEAKGAALNRFGSSLRDLLSRPYFTLIRQANQEAVESIAFSPDGQTVASAGDDKKILLWNVNDLSAKPKVLSGHQDIIWSVTFSPDGQTLASASKDETIRLWNLANLNEEPRVLSGHQGGVESVAFSRDGQTLASGGGDGKIRLWNLMDESIEPQILPIEDPKGILFVTFSPDGQTLAESREYGPIRLWDLSNEGNIINQRIILSGTNWIESLAFSPDGQTLAAANWDGVIRLWDLKRPDAVPRKLLGHENQIRSVVFSPDGQTLASASNDLTIRLWPLENITSDSLNITPDILTGHQSYVKSLAFSPNGKTLASASYDETIRFWDLTPPKAKPIELTGHQGRVWSVALTPDGKTIASASEYKTIHLWQMNDSQFTRKHILDVDQEVWSVAFSPNGDLLASGGKNKLHVWDFNGPNQTPQIYLTYEGEVRSVAFSPNGRTLAFVHSDKNIHLWDLSTSNPSATSIILKGHKERVNFVAFSPDGRLLASASNDQTIRLWNLTNPTSEPRVLTGHENSVKSVAFSPDRLLLASSSNDRTIRLWDLETLELKRTLTGHQKGVSSIAFTADSQTLASGAHDNTIRIWDLTDTNVNAQPFVLTGHKDWVRSVAFSPNGETLLSASDDKTVRLWKPHLETLVELGCQQVQRNLTWQEWQNDLEEQPYKKTCDHLPIHSSLIDAGRQLAREGQVEQAIAHLEEILKLDPSLELQPEEEARRYANAGALVKEGRELAKEGNRDAAAHKFQEALGLDSEALDNTLSEEIKELALGLIEDGIALAYQNMIELAIDKFNKAQTIYPSVMDKSNAEARHTFAVALIKEGRELAKEGNRDAAAHHFQEALRLDSQVLDNKLSEEIKELALGLIEDGVTLAYQNQIGLAIDKFNKAKKIYPRVVDESDAEAWHTLCLHGNDPDYARKVLFACNQAIKLDPGNSRFYISRAILRLLAGNHTGANDDLDLRLLLVNQNHGPNKYGK